MATTKTKTRRVAELTALAVILVCIVLVLAELWTNVVGEVEGVYVGMANGVGR